MHAAAILLVIGLVFVLLTTGPDVEMLHCSWHHMVQSIMKLETTKVCASNVVTSFSHGHRGVDREQPRW
jgi:hypothetical protein